MADVGAPADLPISARAAYVELRDGTGRRVIRLQFVLDGGAICLLPTANSARWPVAVLAAGEAEVRDPSGAWTSFGATLVRDRSRVERVGSAMREKYGVENWRRHFSSASKVLALLPGPPARRPDPQELVRAEFDAIATDYHATVERNPFERYLKGRTQQALLTRLAGLDPLLEIGPGTGWETIPLLRAGHHVVAVDVSPNMIAELERRASQLGLAERLTTQLGHLGALDDALRSYDRATFAAAYSTFGAFNLEARMDGAAASLARALRPSGRLIFTSLNRPGLSPFLWELLSGNPRGALARFGRLVPAPRIRYPLDVHLAGPAETLARFEPYFQRVRVEALSVLAPPFDSPKLARAAGASGLLAARRLDEGLVRLPGSRLAAEWVLYDLRRRDQALGAPA